MPPERLCEQGSHEGRGALGTGNVVFAEPEMVWFVPGLWWWPARVGSRNHRERRLGLACPAKVSGGWKGVKKGRDRIGCD